jgi:hypothetical protein
MSHAIYIRVPETLLYGFGFEKPSLVYSTRTGKLELISNVADHKVDEFLDFCMQEINFLEIEDKEMRIPI